MIHFETKMKSTIQLLLIIVVYCCLGLLACSCATLYVQPANIKQGSVEIAVTVDKLREPNGLAINGFPPEKIKIIPKRAGQWGEPVYVNLQKGQYRQTFDDIEEYKIDKSGLSIAFEVGQGAGPYKVSSSTGPLKVPDFEQGNKLVQEYRRGELIDYRLVIELHLISPANRDKFLQGFKAAYKQTNEETLGEKYTNILKQSIEGGVYEQAFELGKRHANKKVTDALVQTTIGRSLGLGGFELGWKAGYIEGFVQGRMESSAQDKEILYRQAETVYNNLRAAF